MPAGSSPASPRPAPSTRRPTEAAAKRRLARESAARLRLRLELASHFPELGEEALVESRPEVADAGRSAGAQLAADLALDHVHVARTPDGEALVVVEERLGEVDQVGEAIALPVESDEVGSLASLEQAAEGIPKSALAQAARQPLPILG